MWFCYILECCDGTFYTGITNNIEKRIKCHNSRKGAKYTRTRTPVSLKWIKNFSDRATASKEEYRIKKLTRLEKIKIIENN